MDKKEVRTLEVAPGEEDSRLDRWLKRRWPHLNHVQIHKLTRSGQIKLFSSANQETKLLSSPLHSHAWERARL